MPRTYYVIDAFASEPFTGNPAAVVPDAAGLDDREMQRIAAEFNLSETTFILPSKVIDARAAASVRFRWFTPTVEVDMCGHATVAGLHALLESGRVRREDPMTSTVVRIETKSGVLTGFIESIPGQESGVMIWLEMIPPMLRPHAWPIELLAAALRLPVDAFESSLPMVQSQDRDVLVFVRDFMVLNDARPDFGRLGELLTGDGLRGLCLATVKTVTPSIHVQSRFFAPSCGIDEDPVTGSVHGPLAAYLAERGLVPLHNDLAGMTCTQGVPGGRTGLVHALAQRQSDGRYAVRIGGRAITTMRGSLLV